MGNELKRKTSMVLHQIEESLGNFVLHNGSIDSLNEDRLENIYQREADKGRKFNKRSIQDVVEATYLDELFGFALDIVTDSSAADSINYLYSLFHHFDIYEIRNALSHPNRPFWDCYWYRVAAIASDPVNEILRLDEIKKTLLCAEAGNISDPPDDWVNKIIWQIPNNLPKTFDHGLTGLIGRSKELIELSKFLENPRVNTIALVAPGGAGKTALALDLLNNVISTPSYTKFIDAVIYVTMKTEKLTTNGIIPLDAIETIEDLRTSIVHSINVIFDENYLTFEEAIEGKKECKLLLCIDNLETLLRDSHEKFEELNYSLPANWQVLVTSRVTISNATILSLEALKEKSAIHLARTYASKRGGLDLDEKAYANITQSCFYNPLAIRLTIDLALTGRDIPSSLNVANKEIAEFSYNNLIEALSDDAIEILEAVFVENTSSRFSLCDLLKKSLDEISIAIGELSKTSLLIRCSSEQGEVYNLSDSVKDLLLISPKNIDIRNSVQDKIHKRRVLSKEIDIKQANKELPNWHIDYVPNNTPENLKIFVSQINSSLSKARKNRDVAVDIFRKLRESGFIYENEYLYHKCFGRILEVLNDYNSAEQHYKKSIEIHTENPSVKYLLARLYHSTKRYSDAFKVYETLINDGWINEDPDNLSFGKTIYNGYFLSLLYDGHYEPVLDKTKKWKEAGLYRGVLGTYRASAWKRKMENIVDIDTNLTVECLSKASKILSDVFRSEGYFKVVNKQAIKVFEEIEFCFSRSTYSEHFPNQAHDLLSFISDNIIEVLRDEKSFDTNSFISKLEKINVNNNPFKSKNWHQLSKLSNYEFIIDDTPEFSGLIQVRISNRPKEGANYIFAKDGFGETYFLHFDNFKHGDWRVWCQLAIGDKLLVAADQLSKEPSRAIPTSEIYIQN
jgi:tetratricopeptide (TPR) repeat protein